jgi:hypothetical protein
MNELLPTVVKCELEESRTYTTSRRVKRGRKRTMQVRINADIAMSWENIHGILLQATLPAVDGFVLSEYRSWSLEQRPGSEVPRHG